MHFEDNNHGIHYNDYSNNYIDNDYDNDNNDNNPGGTLTAGGQQNEFKLCTF